MQIYKNLFNYYFTPFKEVYRTQSITASLRATFFLIILHWAFFILIEFVAIPLLQSINLLDEPTFKLTFAPTLIGNLLISGLIIPVIEEVINRQWIVYTRHNIALSMSLFFSALIHKVATHHYQVPFNENLYIGIKAIKIGAMIYLTIYNLLKPVDLVVKNFWRNNQKTIVIVSAVIFGYLHIGNYKITANLLIFSPIVLGTYLMAGFLMGYLRVKFGFLYNTLFHITTNSALLILKFMAFHR